MPALVSTLADVRSLKVRVTTVDSERPSPFAAALLFSYVASFLYDGDAPLAERRAQALAVDQTQLRELVGDADLRELLDADSLEAVEHELQRLDPRYRAASADGLHDMLLSLGDLTRDEIRARTTSDDVASTIDQLVASALAISIRIIGCEDAERYIAVEDAARYRDALGVELPRGIPEALLSPARDPVGNLARRYARTHGPFTPTDFADRYALDLAVADATLGRLTADGALIEGDFRPGGIHREWTDAGVLRQLRRRSLAKLRRETEPVDHAVFGRLTTAWQGIVRKRQGSDALLDAIEQLQGTPLAASILETEILPARIDGYDPADLDSLTAAGEVVWAGVEALGDRDGRIALYLADQLPRLLPPSSGPGTRGSGLGTPGDPRESAILKHLHSHGASFFGPLHEAAGGGYPAETVSTLWSLVWRGLITNDTFHVLRAFTQARAPRRRARRHEVTAFRSRRSAPPSAEGRWTLVTADLKVRTTPDVVQAFKPANTTAWAAAWAQQLLARHGVLTREAAGAETSVGGFGVVYPVLKAMEESGKIRRGYFVAGLGATQFALPGALDLLRSLREPLPDDTGAEVVMLSATDPASPYGAAIRFPAALVGRGATRTVGATVILVNGALGAYLARGDRMMLTFLPEAEPQRSKTARAIARVLRERSRMPVGEDQVPRGILIEEIDGLPPSTHPIAPYLAKVGFISGAMGFQGN
jgi:ATP-dependent Lhr-like helicase